MLSSHGVIVAATSVQSDPMATLCYVVGFVAFARWLERPSSRVWMVWVVATALAALLKPTMLQLGVAQATLVAVAHRDRARHGFLWLGWGLVLVLVAVYLWHARALYLTYGNTFGILSGGDSKLPVLERLAERWRWRQLATAMAQWGTGLLALPAAGVLLWARRCPAAIAALTAGGVTLGVLAFRYTSHAFGTHYHLPLCLLGAWAVAAAVAHLSEQHPRSTFAVIGLVGVVGVVLGAHTVRWTRGLPSEHETVLGQQLAALAPPRTLVVVRSSAPRRADAWRTENNFQDPRVMYLSRTRGWVLPSDAHGATELSRWHEAGARFYVHLGELALDAELAAWLSTTASPAWSGDAGTVYRLR